MGVSERERARRVVERFSAEMPEVGTELHYRDDFTLLVAVILSAQCTDVRVNQITPGLFASYPDAERMSAASEDDVFELIRSCSYPRAKAGYLVGTAKRLVEEYGGAVPSEIEDLLTLPGVGRKTANVIRTVLFDIPAIPVDTHVHRVSGRLGLTTGSRSVEETERRLMELFPSAYWGRLHHWLILHGRYVCKARRAACAGCFLRDVCATGVEEQGLE